MVNRPHARVRPSKMTALCLTLAAWQLRLRSLGRSVSAFAPRPVFRTQRGVTWCQRLAGVSWAYTWRGWVAPFWWAVHFAQDLRRRRAEGENIVSFVTWRLQVNVPVLLPFAHAIRRVYLERQVAWGAAWDGFFAQQSASAPVYIVPVAGFRDSFFNGSHAPTTSLSKLRPMLAAACLLVACLLPHGVVAAAVKTAVFPTILVDSTSGAASDTACSGAGPSTAITGSAAASDGTNGKTVTITDAVNLAGVATDGSAVLYLADTTAGHRRFDQITAVSGTSGNWTVTVQNGFSLSLSGKSWAIGGKRATLTGAVSALLYNNNGSAGDAMPGWTLEMQSGHVETGIGSGGSTAIPIVRGGDTTNGPITLRGASGAGTMPLLTFANNWLAIEPTGAITGWRFSDFEMRNSNATKTSSAPFGAWSGGLAIPMFRNLKIAHSTDHFYGGPGCGPAPLKTPSQWYDCEIGYTTTHGILLADGDYGDNMAIVENCWFHDTGGSGCISNKGYAQACQVVGCVIENAGNKGLHFVGNNSTRQFPTRVSFCTIYNATSDGIYFGDDSAMVAMVVENSIIANCGGYGVKFNSGTAVALSYYGGIIRNLALYNNTSGDCNLSGVLQNCQSGVDPQFTNPSGHDYSIGTNLKALGYPLGGTLPVGKRTSTYSYVDIGAAQRQESSGGSSGPPPSFTVVQSARRRARSRGVS